jgi:hypothetical protein
MWWPVLTSKNSLSMRQHFPSRCVFTVATEFMVCFWIQGRSFSRFACWSSVCLRCFSVCLLNIIAEHVPFVLYMYFWLNMRTRLMLSLVSLSGPQTPPAQMEWPQSLRVAVQNVAEWLTHLMMSSTACNFIIPLTSVDSKYLPLYTV